MRVHADDQTRTEQTDQDTSRASSQMQVSQGTTTKRSTSHTGRDHRARKQKEQERYQRADKHCGATKLNRSHEVVLSIGTPGADQSPTTSHRCARPPGHKHLTGQVEQLCSDETSLKQVLKIYAARKPTPENRFLGQRPPVLGLVCRDGRPSVHVLWQTSSEPQEDKTRLELHVPCKPQVASRRHFNAAHAHVYPVGHGCRRFKRHQRLHPGTLPWGRSVTPMQDALSGLTPPP